MWHLIYSFLFCRHDWRLERPGATLYYVGGFKGLHRCANCGRLKYIKIDSPDYEGNSSPA